MSKQSGVVLLFPFLRRERELPIRDTVTRHVKEFVFISEALSVPSCRYNVRGLLTCQRLAGIVALCTGTSLELGAHGRR